MHLQGGKMNIINIQRFSIHDGPGIRTTVFLKGCNLRCLWCHNPESQSLRSQRMFFRHKCIGCGACIQVCAKAFEPVCNACGKCVEVCRYGAREISGKNISVEECFREIQKDKDFYLVSGGGVTFSGGEPLLQGESLLEILKLCKGDGIHTAIETAGNVEWNQIEAVLPYLDYILYDIKAINEEKHQEFTGVSNRLILENAQKLMKAAKGKLLFRMPVIPGYNDSEYEKIAEFVKGYPLELLPYHTIGKGKYDALGMTYPLDDVKAPTAEDMRRLADKYEHVFCEENMV